VLDQKERVIAVFMGKPVERDRAEGQTWDDACGRLAIRLEELRRQSFQGEHKDHRRGSFATVTLGFLYGGGQKAPMNLRLEGRRLWVVKQLKKDLDMRRLAGFGSVGMASYFPLAYDHFRDRLRALHQGTKGLQYNFPNSVYPTCTVNLGPSTVCLEHNNATNYPGLPCSITPLGNYDPSRGGHLCLFDLKLYVRFPPGCTALILSAGLCHGNTPIGSTKKRYSFTQYCVGGLVRWSAYGCR
ncbi:hypothetical protein BC834DRAFT_805445, partial [Gloeopeniophorella convolvens]